MDYLNKSGLTYFWNKIKTAINSETTARQNADTSLSNQITSLQNDSLSVSVTGEVLIVTKGGS